MRRSTKQLLGLPIIWKMLLSVVGLLTCLPMVMVTAQGWGFSEEGMRHYCEGQDFEAECGQDEVVLMHAALYGRMHRSNCLQIDSGDRNCKVDVLDYFDSRCSGRHSCAVKVSSIIDEYPSQSCLKDYRGYLEADYSCVKVSTASKVRCATGGTVPATQYPTGYLANIITDDTECGSLDSPWVLTVSSGQTIRLSLLDFAASGRDKSGFIQDIPLVCHVYAVVREAGIGASETVCGSNSRNTLVYTSVTSQLEVRMTGKQKDDGGYYLLKYTAVGCPAIAPPTNGWMEKLDDGSLKLGCNGSGQDTWRLVCENNQWTGMRDRNCSMGGGTVAAGHDRSIIGILTGSEWASIIIILTIAVTLGLTIFLIGLVYLRRKRDRLDRQQAIMRADRQSIPDYYATQNQDNNTVDSGYGNGNGGGGGGSKSMPPPADAYPCQENDYFRTWQMQRHTSLPGRGSSLPPLAQQQQQQQQPSYDTMMESSKERRNVEHIYESPKFERKDCVLGLGGVGGLEREPGTNVQYYELDPEAVDENYPG